MPFLTSHPHIVISVSFLSKFLHVFICKYTSKLWKKAALGEGGKYLDSLSFLSSKQCLGILHVVYVLMIPVFLNI